MPVPNKKSTMLLKEAARCEDDYAAPQIAKQDDVAGCVRGLQLG